MISLNHGYVLESIDGHPVTTSTDLHSVTPTAPDGLCTFALFDRHDLPPHAGGILFIGYNFQAHTGRKRPDYKSAITGFMNGQMLHLYVTGLTQALGEFLADLITLRLTWLRLNEPTGGLTLWHYDRELKGYHPQIILPVSI